METSKEIIEQAKQRFKELKHKNYDWVSFYTGFLEAKVLIYSNKNIENNLTDDELDHYYKKQN